MAKARTKKKHICVECGESFNHGIGLRKHQRQSGHKGSRIEEEGAEPPAPPPPEPEPEPEVEPEPESEPEEPSVETEEPEYDDDDDQTVVVSRRSAPTARRVGSARSSPPPPTPIGQAEMASNEPSRIQETKTKLNLVSRGMKVVLSAKAKDAGRQFKQSARSGADIFQEALKLAVALSLLIVIPTLVFFWWRAQNPTAQPQNSQTEVFSIEDGSRAARSSLLRYLDHLKKQEWEEAYSYLSSDWRSEFAFASFKDAFLDIEDLRWAVGDQRLLADGQAEVTVRLAFREGGRPRNFVGRFRMLKGTQQWRIDRAELSSVPSS